MPKAKRSPRPSWRHSALTLAVVVVGLVITTAGLIAIDRSVMLRGAIGAPECNGEACGEFDLCAGVVCPPASDQCHTAGTCDPLTGMCDNPIAPNGTGCNDGDLCTNFDECHEGVCFGAAVICDTPAEECRSLVGATCNPATGICMYPNAASPGELCTAGFCVEGGQCNSFCFTANDPVCDDGNPCTNDSCNVASDSCVHTNNTAVCDDANACTLTDRCSAGECRGSNPVVCPAASECFTSGSCDPLTGTCDELPSTGNVCDDNDPNTVYDECLDGVCMGYLPLQTCSNDFREGSEVCDGIDLNFQTCITRGYDEGELFCNPSCTGFDESLCTREPGGGVGGGSGGGTGGDAPPDDPPPVPPAADVSLSLSVDPVQAFPGDRVTYTLRVQNDGYWVLNSSQFVIKIPQGLTPDLSPLASAAWDAQARTVTWSPFILWSGTTDFTAGGTVVETALPGTTITATGYATIANLALGPKDANVTVLSLLPSAPAIVCGDGVRNGTEQCEGTDYGGKTCLHYGLLDGALRCVDCVIQIDQCVPLPFTPPTMTACPNGILEPGEQCDPPQYGGKTCADFDLVQGELTCDANCAISTASCLPQPPPPQGLFSVKQFAAPSTAKPGDTVTITINVQNPTSTIFFLPTIEQVLPEGLDFVSAVPAPFSWDPATRTLRWRYSYFSPLVPDPSATISVTAKVTTPTAGPLSVIAGGQTVTGISIPSDGTVITVAPPPVCGNKTVESLDTACTDNDDCPWGVCIGGICTEQCDDGNTIDTDACTLFCAKAICGDGFIQDGVETCDDGKQCSDGTQCTTDAQCAGKADLQCKPRAGDTCGIDCHLEVPDLPVTPPPPPPPSTPPPPPPCVALGEYCSDQTKCCPQAQANVPVHCSFSTKLGNTACGICGDKERQSAEQCDGTELNDATCVSRGFDGGDLACSNACGFDESLCTTLPLTILSHIADPPAQFAGQGITYKLTVKNPSVRTVTVPVTITHPIGLTDRFSATPGQFAAASFTASVTFAPGEEKEIVVTGKVPASAKPGDDMSAFAAAPGVLNPAKATAITRGPLKGCILVENKGLAQWHPVVPDGNGNLVKPEVPVLPPFTFFLDGNPLTSKVTDALGRTIFAEVTPGIHSVEQLGEPNGWRLQTGVNPVQPALVQAPKDGVPFDAASCAVAKFTNLELKSPLTITKIPSPSLISPSNICPAGAACPTNTLTNIVSFLITIKNSNTLRPITVQVSDSLPPGALFFDSLTDNNVPVLPLQQDGNKITWTATIPENSSKTYVLTAHAADAIDNNGAIIFPIGLTSLINTVEIPEVATASTYIAVNTPAPLSPVTPTGIQPGNLGNPVNIQPVSPVNPMPTTPTTTPLPTTPVTTPALIGQPITVAPISPVTLTVPPSVPCNNGILNPGEQCDIETVSTCKIDSECTGGFCIAGKCTRFAGTPGSSLCSTLDPKYVGGNLSCGADCTYNRSQCTLPPPPPPSLCNNGLLNAGEECDTDLSRTCTVDADCGALPGLFCIAGRCTLFAGSPANRTCEAFNSTLFNRGDIACRDNCRVNDDLCDYVVPPAPPAPPAPVGVPIVLPPTTTPAPIGQPITVPPVTPPVTPPGTTTSECTCVFSCAVSYCEGCTTKKDEALCSSACQAAYTAECTHPAAPEPCGNGALDGTEECDIAPATTFCDLETPCDNTDAFCLDNRCVLFKDNPADLLCSTYDDQQFNAGEISCAAGCQLNLQQCAMTTPTQNPCGNGALDGTEECDIAPATTFCDLETPCANTNAFCIANRCVLFAGNPANLFCSTLDGTLYNRGEIDCAAGCELDDSACAYVPLSPPGGTPPSPPTTSTRKHLWCDIELKSVQGQTFLPDYDPANPAQDLTKGLVLFRPPVTVSEPGRLQKYFKRGAGADPIIPAESALTRDGLQACIRAKNSGICLRGSLPANRQCILGSVPACTAENGAVFPADKLSDCCSVLTPAEKAKGLCASLDK